jgi:hypothetical protein
LRAVQELLDKETTVVRVALQGLYLKQVEVEVEEL